MKTLSKILPTFLTCTTLALNFAPVLALENIVAVPDATTMSSALKFEDFAATQFENSNTTPAETLGYYTFDIATAIVSAATSAGSNVAKTVSLKTAEKYSAETLATNVNKNGFIKSFNSGVAQTLKKEEAGITAEVVQDITDQQVVKSLVQNGGKKMFTQGGNPIRYAVGARNTTLRPIVGGFEVDSLLGDRVILGHNY